MPITRRTLLDAVARLGGAAAVYEALVAWDFLRAPPAMAAPLELAKASGTGRTVAILGAGVAGLCAAYELDRAGYVCTVLEASKRPGGRSLTLRRGDTFQEMGGPVQECRFDEGLWLNAGPGRIPHQHTHLIDYCRRFGVALQPYIFASRANLFHSGTLGNGRTMQVRRAYYDLQGQIAELLDKCVVKPDMDLPISRDDLATFRDMLARFGDLTKIEHDGKIEYVYRNRFGRAGYDVLPGGADEAGRPVSPMALDEILRSNVWNDYMFREHEFFWQTSLLEPVGGMDNFFKGFLRQPARSGGTIARLVRTNAKVTALDIAADSVTVSYWQDGKPRTLAADFCISTIPAPIFATLKTNLPAAYMSAAEKLPVQAAGKVGWQAERFWETRDQIYGGISWTTDPITQVWYPSSGFLGRKGVLTGAYMYGVSAERFNAQTLAERLRQAEEQGDKLHDGYSTYVERGLAIGWNNMEFERMGWADEGDPAFAPNAKLLSEPQGRFHMAGDQLTYWSGWQEGALISAHAAVSSIDRMTKAPANR
ncbi:flavin monoamine oxidase family protein [Rhodoplanes sp. Z2-YC6860]|uniref:flavin monoamine oxidase family protein n=1 Tax=Rhodoplanes sp. Z2-YC6860 TaxID=674703 RepID=UPI00078D511C|nr:FAD-dependent oxidoreductase [Rhodoplanes sp. Z2-YC6860]AMN41801.1 monoamine oxidase [Rhodoplanes sp. Z2-YC6860]